MGNILVVEDDPNIRKLVRVNLVKRGYTVSEAADSHQAIALFQEGSVDLVLLDLLLPGLSGVDVCKWIRAKADQAVPNPRNLLETGQLPGGCPLLR